MPFTALGSPSHERPAPRGQCGPGVLGLQAYDWGILALRGSGRVICAAPAAGGLGGVGDRAQKPAECFLLAPDTVGLLRICGMRT